MRTKELDKWLNYVFSLFFAATEVERELVEKLYLLVTFDLQLLFDFSSLQQLSEYYLQVIEADAKTFDIDVRVDGDFL